MDPSQFCYLVNFEFDADVIDQLPPSPDFGQMTMFYLNQQFLKAFDFVQSFDEKEALEVIEETKEKLRSPTLNLALRSIPTLADVPPKVELRKNILRLIEITLAISKDGWTPAALNAIELRDILLKEYENPVDQKILRECTGSVLPQLFYDGGYPRHLLRVMLDIHFTRFNGVEMPGSLAHYFKMRYLLNYFLRSADLQPITGPNQSTLQVEMIKAEVLEQLVISNDNYERCPTELLKDYDEAAKYSTKLFQYCKEVRERREQEIREKGDPEQQFDLHFRYRLNFKRAAIYSSLAKMNSKDLTKIKLYQKSVDYYLEDRKEVVTQMYRDKEFQAGALRLIDQNLQTIYDGIIEISQKILGELDKNSSIYQEKLDLLKKTVRDKFKSSDDYIQLMKKFRQPGDARILFTLCHRNEVLAREILKNDTISLKYMRDSYDYFHETPHTISECVAAIKVLPPMNHTQTSFKKY